MYAANLSRPNKYLKVDSSQLNPELARQNIISGLIVWLGSVISYKVVNNYLVFSVKPQFVFLSYPSGKANYCTTMVIVCFFMPQGL